LRRARTLSGDIPDGGNHGLSESAKSASKRVHLPTHPQSSFEMSHLDAPADRTALACVAFGSYNVSELALQNTEARRSIRHRRPSRVDCR
jgi:hypothetical protein